MRSIFLQLVSHVVIQEIKHFDLNIGRKMYSIKEIIEIYARTGNTTQINSVLTILIRLP